ncbi:MAG: hypothetical protein UIM25_06255 [Bacteroidales bacterium]|nr:hypothetical protein [Bacteroidales bacterium]
MRKQGGHLFLNCTIRDVILPHEYVWVDLDCQSRKVTLVPTHEEDAYKMSLDKTGNANLANICWWGLDRICHIPDGTRIKAKIEDNGTITFVVPET